MPDKDSAPALDPRGFQPEPPTCDEYYVNKLTSKHVNTCAGDPALSRKRPEEQSNDEWLDEYSSQSDHEPDHGNGNHNLPTSDGKLFRINPVATRCDKANLSPNPAPAIAGAVATPPKFGGAVTAAELLDMAQAEGVALAFAGDRLAWAADYLPRPELLDELAAHKAELIAALATAAEQSQVPTAPAPASTPVPAPESAPEAASELRRNAWTITRSDKPICTICGSPMTRTEALAEAHWRWPDANIMKE